MKRIQFTKTYTKDAFATRLQHHLQQLFDKIFASPLVQGVHVKDINISTGSDNIVSHKLGTAYQGFVITNKDAIADIYLSSTENTVKQRQIILKTTANVTADLYIF